MAGWPQGKTEKEELKDLVDKAMQMNARQADVLSKLMERIDKMHYGSEKRFDAIETAALEIRCEVQNGFKRLTTLEAALKPKAA